MDQKSARQIGWGILALIALGWLAWEFRAEVLPSAAREDDTGIARHSYEEIVRQTREVAARYPAMVEIIESREQTTQGRRVIAARVGQREESAEGRARPVAILVEGLHGIEFLNVVPRLISGFLGFWEQKEHPVTRFLERGGIILMVPIANPDGYELGQRRNARFDVDGWGHDLNRDWADPAWNDLATRREEVAFKEGPPKGAVFREVETRFVRDLVAGEMARGNRRFALSVGYHCCVDYLFFPWIRVLGDDCPATSQKTRDLHRRAGEHFKRVFGIDFGTGDTVIPGTMDRYFAQVYPGSVNLTFDAESVNVAEGAGGGERRNMSSTVHYELVRHLRVFEQVLAELE
jgi:hypothetical protein